MSRESGSVGLASGCLAGRAVDADAHNALQRLERLACVPGRPHATVAMAWSAVSNRFSPTLSAYPKTRVNYLRDPN